MTIQSDAALAYGKPSRSTSIVDSEDTIDKPGFNQRAK
jgi:hypothetical protein